MSINVRRLRIVAAFAWVVPAVVLLCLNFVVPMPQVAAAPRATYAISAQNEVTASIARVRIAGTGSQAAASRERLSQTGWIANNGFEIDADGNVRADTWSESARAFQGVDVKRSGAHSLMLNSVANRDFRVWQSVHNVHAGQTFDVSGWVNVPATDDAFTFELAVAWKDSKGQVLRVDSVKTWNAATGGWDKGAASFVVPQGTNSAVVRLNTANLAATVYVDDISFQAR